MISSETLCVLFFTECTDNRRNTDKYTHEVCLYVKACSYKYVIVYVQIIVDGPFPLSEVELC